MQRRLYKAFLNHELVPFEPVENSLAALTVSISSKAFYLHPSCLPLFVLLLLPSTSLALIQKFLQYYMKMYGMVELMLPIKLFKDSAVCIPDVFKFGNANMYVLV